MLGGAGRTSAVITVMAIARNRIEFFKINLLGFFVFACLFL